MRGGGREGARGARAGRLHSGSVHPCRCCSWDGERGTKGGGEGRGPACGGLRALRQLPPHSARAREQAHGHMHRDGHRKGACWAPFLLLFFLLRSPVPLPTSWRGVYQLLSAKFIRAPSGHRASMEDHLRDAIEEIRAMFEDKSRLQKLSFLDRSVTATALHRAETTCVS